MKIFKFFLMMMIVFSIIGCERGEDTETASFIGVSDVTIEFGSNFDPLEGVSVVDSVEGLIDISEIKVEGTIDTHTVGSYTIIYKVTGSDGNEVTVTRIITVEEEPLVCGDNQEEQNGVCVIIDQDLEDIKIALNSTLLLTNYQMDVVITYSEHTIEYSYEMTLSFDDNIALFEMGENDITYYETTPTGTNAYIKQGDVFVLKPVDSVEGFSFYEDLDPSWFTKIGDYYLLGSQHIASISGMLKDYFPEGALNNFKIGLNEDVLDYFKFDVVSGDMVYQLTFTFDMIDEVDLRLPTV